MKLNARQTSKTLSLDIVDGDNVLMGIDLPNEEYSPEQISAALMNFASVIENRLCENQKMLSNLEITLI